MCKEVDEILEEVIKERRNSRTEDSLGRGIQGRI